MAIEEKIICVGCPLGCEITLTTDDKGEVTEVTGNTCKEGKEYALEEFKNPVRVLTATVLTEGSERPLLPVRTNKPIFKSKLKECMPFLAKVRARPPIRAGQVIVPNIINIGADLVSTGELLR